MRRSLLVVAATLTLASSALATAIPIGPLDAGPATHAHAPALANSAHGSFMIWLDSRRYRSLDNSNDLYGSAVDTNGSLVEPFGHLLAYGVHAAAIASNGNGYLVVFATDDGNVDALPLDENGNARSAPAVIARGNVYGAASNGNGYCALIDNAAVIMDGAAKPLATIAVPVDFSPAYVLTPAVVAVGSQYDIVQGRLTCPGTTACTIAVHVIELTGSTAIDHKILDGIPYGSSTSAIAVNGRLFVGITQDDALSAQRLTQLLVTDAAGNVLVPLRAVNAQPTLSNGGGAAPTFAFDGRKVLVAWPSFAASDLPPIVAVRVAPDGTPIDSQPFPITPPAGGPFALSSGSGAITAAWTEFHRSASPYNSFGHSELHVAHFASVDAIALTEGDVVRARAMQSDPAIAASGSHALVVWREFDQPSAIRAASIDVHTGTATDAITVAPAGSFPLYSPAVASVGNVALVAWTQQDANATTVLARRVTIDGSLIDAQMLVVAVVPSRPFEVSGVSVATSGSEFLVSWNVAEHVEVARVRRDGSVVDPSAIEYAPNVGEIASPPRAAWTGDHYLVTWIGGRENPIPDLILPPFSSARAIVVTRSGEVTNSAATNPIFSGIISFFDFDLTAGDSSVLLSESDASGDANALIPNTICTNVRLLDNNGEPKSGAAQISCDQLPTWRVYPRHVSAAWTGRDFAVAWANQSTADIRLTSVSREGVPAGTTNVTAPGSNTFDPAIARSDDGLVVVYTAVADQPPFAGAQRLFAEVLPFGPHRRAVGRR